MTSRSGLPTDPVDDGTSIDGPSGTAVAGTHTGPGRAEPAGPTWARRLVLVVTAGGAIVMFPWVVVLSVTLPATQPGGAWRASWVGFDIGLAAVLAVTAISVWRSSRTAPLWLSVGAALVLTDAWFDVCLSWGSPGQRTAVLTALVVELPAATLLIWAARRPRNLRSGQNRSPGAGLR